MRLTLAVPAVAFSFLLLPMAAGAAQANPPSKSHAPTHHSTTHHSTTKKHHGTHRHAKHHATHAAPHAAPTTHQ